MRQLQIYIAKKILHKQYVQTDLLISDPAVPSLMYFKILQY